MAPEQYQNLARRTLVTNNEQDTLAMCALGIAGEAGEICDMLKKHLYHKNGKGLDEDKLADEAGDLLWYASIMAYTLSIPMGKIIPELEPLMIFPEDTNKHLIAVALNLTEVVGDVAWYTRMSIINPGLPIHEEFYRDLEAIVTDIAILAVYIGLSLEEIMQRNIAKLEARHNGGNGFKAHYESDSGDSKPDSLATVRGSIIGALAGGHMHGSDGYSYSKGVLLQIAGELGLDIPASVIEHGESKGKTPRYFVIDDYTLETIADCSTKAEAQKAMQDESNETGIFVYSIIEAVDEAALNQILAEREGFNA